MASTSNDSVSSEKGQDYSARLAELEGELTAHSGQEAGTPRSALPSLSHVATGRIGDEAVVNFMHRGKAYSVGHTDTAFPGTHGVRGLRLIHFYDASKKVVLGIAGEFDHQSFGANFRVAELKTYRRGAWELSFLVMTDGLRTFRGDRKEELRQIRARTAGR